jgi:leucyl aminopeptidase
VQLAFSPGLPADADLTVRLFAPDTPPEGAPEAAVRDAEKEPVLLYEGDRRTALVALGKEGDEQERLRDAAAKGAALAARIGAQRPALALSGLDAEAAAALVEGFILGGYRFLDYKTGDAGTPPAETLTLVTGEATDAVHQAAHAALIRAEAACLARDLVNRSPHDKTAPLLAEATRALAEAAGLRCEVWDRERIEAERMGGLLAVSRGSQAPPRFVVLEHRPQAPVNDRPVVLVGKAVVFDTGGLSLKPTKNSMDRMKADMAGGAAVIGAVVAAARLALPVHVVALVPMTDNRPGEDAYVPGDVVTMRSGLTVEVLNTDAEGRMLLADALDYAKTFEPELVVDVATLTGAAVIALGDRVAGLLTPEGDGAEARTRALVEAGRRTGEWVHPLPMHAHYAALLESDVADLKNVGGPGAGTISAAKFLERFTQHADGEAAYPWAHLDIAGPAFIDSPQPYRPKGGTGFGARLLTALLEERAEEPGDR